VYIRSNLEYRFAAIIFYTVFTLIWILVANCRSDSVKQCNYKIT
jgi:hypothetical protein